MAEHFHRRGHHVQKAHGRRVHLASDGSHLSGGMIALMPTPEDARRLALPGGEAAADLHCTLFFLGDDGAAWTEDQRNELEALVRAASSGLTPVKTNVFGAAHWNGAGDNPSWVWSVEDSPDQGLADSHLNEVRYVAQDALESTHERPEIPVQHSPWVAHICAAYTDDLTLLRTLEKRLGPVTFDRIRLSFGDDDRDIPLTATAVNLTASALRREPTRMEAYCDFAEHNRQWEGAVDAASRRLADVYTGWRAQLREQVTSLADEPLDLTALTVTPGDAAAILFEGMTALARRAGDALQREAERQGVRVPGWELPDDTVTAAVGGRRLLDSVARMTADLMAGSVVQAAKRTVTGLFTRNAPPEEIAGEVDRALADAEQGIVRGPVGTAMSTAQTAGRQAVLEAAPPGEYYASEILDKNTCGPCKAVDGEQFGSLEIAIKAYPVMGYKDCVGSRYGNPCRGMIVARWTPEEAQTASAVTIPSETHMIGEGTVPWHKVHNHSGCASGEWAVVKDSDGSVAGCHGSEGDADDQLAALYASEGDATVTTEALKDQYADGERPGSDCPPGMRHDEATGKCVKDTGDGGAPVDTMASESLEMTGATAPWRGPLTVEGIETGDGREFESGSLTWADLPLPLRWNIEDSHGGEPRTKAVNVGRIDRIWREDSGLIMGEGVLDLSDDNGQKAYSKIEGKFLRGVSVDVDSIKDADMELVWADADPDGEGEPDPFAQLFASPEKVVFRKGRIRAATLVDIPAFAEAYIALLDQDGAVVAGGEPVGALRQTHVVRARTSAVTRTSPTPPADWFTNPDLSVPTPVTVTPDGRVYGHAALWGTCHIGQTGVCVTPPHEDDHPYFMTGAVACQDAVMASVGQITVGTGHAPLHLGHRAASEHYDNTGAAVADVTVGNDAHGIWLAGSVRPGADPGRVHELRASGQVSGDWRRIGGQLRLVGLLAVNVPGFPVPKLATKYTLGHQLSLVAAGMPSLTETLTEDDLDQIAYRRIMDKLSARVHGER